MLSSSGSGSGGGRGSGHSYFRPILLTATHRKWTHGGWCPKNRRAEDGVIPDQYSGLQETSSKDYAVRTEQNVMDSDGTLILVVDGGGGENASEHLFGGTKLTLELARDKHQRPVLVLDMHQKNAVDHAHQWLSSHKIEVRNVAGPRESSFPGIRDQTRTFLTQVFSFKSSSKTR